MKVIKLMHLNEILAPKWSPSGTVTTRPGELQGCSYDGDSLPRQFGTSLTVGRRRRPPRNNASPYLSPIQADCIAGATLNKAQQDR